MKPCISLSRVMLTAVILAATGIFAHAQTLLFSDDFSGTLATNWANIENSSIINTGDPFSTGNSDENNYANINDGSTTQIARMISKDFVTPEGGFAGLFTARFDLYEPTATNRSDSITIGFTGAGSNQINTGNRINHFSLEDGAISFGSNSATLSVDTPYTFVFFLNNTNSNVANYSGSNSLAAQSGALWYSALGSDDWTLVGTAFNQAYDPESLDPYTRTARRFGFHSFSADRQQIFVDNTFVYSGLAASLIPEPGSSAMLLGGIGMLLLRRRRKRR